MLNQIGCKVTTFFAYMQIKMPKRAIFSWCSPFSHSRATLEPLRSLCCCAGCHPALSVHCCRILSRFKISNLKSGSPFKRGLVVPPSMTLIWLSYDFRRPFLYPPSLADRAAGLLFYYSRAIRLLANFDEIRCKDNTISILVFLQRCFFPIKNHIPFVFCLPPQVRHVV